MAPVTPAPLRRRAQLAERVWRGLNPVLGAVWLAAAAWPAVQFVERVAPAWDGRYLVPFTFVAALEALLAARLLQGGLGRFGATYLFLRAAEVAGLLLALRVFQLWRVVSAGLGLGALDMLLHFIASAQGRAVPWRVPPEVDLGLAVPEFLFGAAVVAAAWALAGQLAGLLWRLEGDVDLWGNDAETLAPMLEERAETLIRLRGLVFGVGCGVLALTASLRLDMPGLTPSAGGAWAGLGNLLLFFSLGLVFIGQGRLANLRARWAAEHILVRPRLVVGWLAGGGLLFLVSGAAALLLPTTYGFGLLDVLRALLAGALFVAQVVFVGLSWLLAVLWHWLTPPAASAPSSAPPATPRAFPTLPPAPDVGVSTTAALEPARALAFWLLFLGALLVTFFYLRGQRPFSAEALHRWAFWGRLRALWQNLRRAGRRTRRELRAWWQGAFPAGPPPASAPAAPRPWLRLGRLAPRDQVRFYYQALLRRAREGGRPRPPAATPYEYARDLRAAWPETAETTEALTEAFVTAQYGRRPVPPTLAHQARALWETWRRAWQMRRRPPAA